MRKVTYPSAAPPQVTTSYFVYAKVPHELVFRFNTNVSASLGVNDITLLNQTTNQIIPASSIGLSYDSAGNTATFTFPGYAAGLLPDGRYRATLSAAGITNTAGQPMPADSVHGFFFLRGDSNRDGRVSLQDFNILATNFGQSGKTFFEGDSNYDGTINLQDFNILAARFGMAV